MADMDGFQASTASLLTCTVPVEPLPPIDERTCKYCKVKKHFKLFPFLSTESSRCLHRFGGRVLNSSISVILRYPCIRFIG